MRDCLNAMLTCLTAIVRGPSEPGPARSPKGAVTRTDDLIARLAAETSAVPPYSIERSLAASLMLGGAAAVALLLAHLGIRPDISAAVATAPFWMKLGFTATVGALGLGATCRLARPGATLRPVFWLTASTPFALVVVMAIFEILTAAPEHRASVWLGNSWRTCPLWILVLAAPILLAAVLSMRAFAPTRLALTGMALGVTAGGVGATIYGMHCEETSAAFMTTWYMLGMGVVGAAGAAIGPRVLRW